MSSHLDFTVLLAKLVTVDWPPPLDSLLLEEVIPLGLGVPVEELVQVTFVSICLWSGNLIQLKVNGSYMRERRRERRERRRERRERRRERMERRRERRERRRERRERRRERRERRRERREEGEEGGEGEGRREGRREGKREGRRVERRGWCR